MQSIQNYMAALFRSLCLAGCALVASIAICAAAIGAPVDSQQSISAIFKQMNVPVEGKFKKFSAQIHFDPAKPTSGHAQIDIDTASFDLGDENFNREARSLTWLDVMHYPRATFTSSSIAPAGNGKYSVSGKLTIRGKTLDVVAPVSLTKQQDKLIFEGTLPIQRLSFGVGQGEWKDTSVVDDRVTIKFRLIATQ